MAKTREMTTIERYRVVKKQNPGVLLLFRFGDFYEAFFEDAEVASRVLGLSLTTMHQGTDKSVPMVGFSGRSLDDYLSRLIKAGYRCSVLG